MKTISGVIQSTTPITISKAASVLSKFMSAETGASQAVNAYLRRATASLDELVRLHLKSDRKKRKKHKSESLAVTAATTNGEVPTGSIGVTQEATRLKNGRKQVDSGNVLVNEVEGEKNQGKGNERRKKKKDTSDHFDEGRLGDKIREEKAHTEVKLGEETERKKHKKRRSGDNVGDSEVNGVGNGNREVENKKENKEEEKTVNNIGGHEEVKKEVRKKRKNREVEEGSRNEAEEEQLSQKKKKKRRRGGEDDN